MKMRVLIAVTLLVSVAVSAQAAIKNTKHDLSSLSTGATAKSTNVDQTCSFCHAPHNAGTNKLLWNRTAASGTMSIYTSFNTQAMRTALGAGNNTLGGDSSSLLCLSCHSLTTTAAVVSGSNNGSTGNSGTMHATTLGMNNLTNDHPVGINYNAAITPSNGGLVATSVDASGNNVVTNAGTTLRLFKSGAGGAYTLECATCHDVHGNALGYGKFLAANPAQSTICTTCHIK
jgi:cytochrome c553